jgi:hypothetical protein
MEQFLMSNTSLSDFIQASATLMLADRPHLWDTLDDAVEDITMAFSDVSSLDEDDYEDYSVHLSGFVLTRVVLDEGFFEYTLSKKLVAFAVAVDEEDAHVHDWTLDSNLTGGIKLNLPELPEDLDIEPDISEDMLYEDDDEL